MDINDTKLVKITSDLFGMLLPNLIYISVCKLFTLYIIVIHKKESLKMYFESLKTYVCLCSTHATSAKILCLCTKQGHESLE